MSDNPFYKAATEKANFSEISNTVSNMARKKSRNILDKNGKIFQNERLFSARPRYARQDQIFTTDAKNKPTDVDAAGSRGDWAYIKLLTSKKQADQYSSGKTDRQVENKSLIGENSIVEKMVGDKALKNYGYDQFMITNVSCSMSEKIQITEVFGDNEVVYYFGHQPMIFNIGGLLIDSADNDWFHDWLITYGEFLRGSQTARNYELVKLILPNMVLTGTISGFGWNQDSSRDTDIAFQFQFIAKIVAPRPASGGNMISSNSMKNVNFSKAKSFLGQSDINNLKGQLDKFTEKITNPESSMRDKGKALDEIGSGSGGSFDAFLVSTKNSIKGFQKTVDGWDKQSKSTAKQVETSSMFKTVTSSLTGIRTNLFSPIYGVLSSLTKLITNTANSVNKLVNSLIRPVRNILRDITNISKKAVALVNLVNNSIKGIGRNLNSQLKGLRNDYKAAIKALKKASGTLASAPQTATHSVLNMFSSGALPANAPFLTVQPKLTFVRPSLTLTGRKPPTKLAILTSQSEYSAKTANTL
jgi:hypothetical protein